uniref:Lysine--tRNA ligase n=1 Tax=candidate division CPR3 bacterium TaxID=2268181 RepID=A0A7C4R4I9_UNCC3
MATIDNLKEARIKKLNILKEKGIDPYPPIVRRKQKIDKARLMEGKIVSVVGRIRGLRGHGKILFVDLVDESARIQVVFKKDNLSHELFSLLELIDIGDFISVQGEVAKTSAGELSVFADNFQIVSKSIRPLPDNWYGFKDVEERYRKRYLDMLLNPEVKKTLDARWKIEKVIRMFLWKENYVEVETPVLQPLYGGTNARPFTTYMNALSSNFYLRVAPELYLKRLIVGGYERVFEIARNFRNEGIDLTHQPEFTMMELYEAYADYKRIMDLTEKLTKYVAWEVNGTYKLQVGGHEVDLEKPWRRITIDQALKDYLKIDWNKISDNEVRKIIEKNQLQVPGVYTKNKALFIIYEHLITDKLIEPTWVIDYPKDVSPLSRSHRSKKDRVERFEGYIGGKEIYDGWSEIVSAIEQRERFEIEQKNLKAGDMQAQPLDEEFLTALEYGCPPLGGIGIGIDRFTMLITNKWIIREVIPFPTLRPLYKTADDKTKKNTIPQEKVSGKTAIKNISREEAWKLLTTYIKNQNLRKHCLAVEAAMRNLAKYFNQDEDLWGIAGLIHDIDYETTKDNSSKHSLLAVDWLKKIDVDSRIIQAVAAHAWGYIKGAPEPKNKLEWSLYCSDDLTGLIVAVALVRPDKKLLSVTIDSVMKKWDSKNFAAGVNRDQIALCEEKLGIKLPEFIGIVLSAMQGICKELGL